MIGVRLSLTGGRESAVRTCLTAVGVGVATAMLLLAASLPTILDEVGERSSGLSFRQSAEYPQPPPAEDTVLLGSALANADHRGTPVTGWVIEPEGDQAPLPPGIADFPEPGEMVVSPALAERLADPDNDLLQRRLDHPVVGQIEEEGLSGPHELVYYLGQEGMEADGAGTVRMDAFGGGEPYRPDTPVILLLGLVGTVVMLIPVVVFLSAAVRFGGQARDRRLAAVRLMGADRAATRRIAAGETVAGVLLGMLIGAGFFVAGRPIVETLPIDDGVFASDVVPSPVLAAGVAVLVPLLALWVALLAVRGVAVEPLGVVRRAERRRPRLWWRLLLPVFGGALLYAGLGSFLTGTVAVNWAVLVSVGLLAVLLGTTAVLPWLVDRAVRTLPSSPLSLQLARRRLASGGDRAVSGIVVTVAGAIALLTLLNGAESTDREGVPETGDPSVGASAGEGPYQRVDLSKEPRVEDPVALFEGEPAIEEAVAVRRTYAMVGDNGGVLVRVADCASLQQLTDLPDCEPGDVFATPGAEVEPGDVAEMTGTEPPMHWTVPQYTELSSGVAGARYGEETLLATPEAMASADPEVVEEMTGAVLLRVDESAPEAREQMLAAAAEVDPTAGMEPLVAHVGSPLDTMKLMLLAGAIACLVMVVAGVTVGTVEQIQERRRVHAVLTAFGARRRTLVGSVLWQTAVPVALGVATACVFGLALGALLLGATGLPMAFDVAEIVTIAAAGAGAIVLATLLTLPALLRTMRADGLRSE
ncbi:FtsX-like permease family protein [Nocardiopsis xinjiangensis]|uniref:FtsX-like permease family protein n=1 Tax=Nocardiopsis xinjiangensis TaxID=124285 RepID=UPI0003496ACC|nr:FtsX-like permease family protein [Nocardiopsis xinjiangensis]